MCELPALIAISPMAHVALLHTDMNSGFRLEPSIGMKSPTLIIHTSHPSLPRVTMHSSALFYQLCLSICLSVHDILVMYLNKCPYHLTSGPYSSGIVLFFSSTAVTKFQGEPTDWALNAQGVGKTLWNSTEMTIMEMVWERLTDHQQKLIHSTTLSSCCCCCSLYIYVCVRVCVWQW